MKIVDCCGPELVIPTLAGRDLRAVLDELVAHLVASVATLDKDAIGTALRDQRQLGSIGGRDGFAILGCTVAGLRRELACFGRSPAGVEVGSSGEPPTHLFFLCLGKAASGAHLKMMAQLSRMLKNPLFRTQLLDAPDAATMHGVLADYEARCT